MIYYCCDELRRSEVQNSALNGIDFIEVLDLEAPTDADRQRFLFLHLINDPGALVLTSTNIQIEGGVRIKEIELLNTTMGVAPNQRIVTIEVEEPGDFSIYTLRLIRGVTDDRPPIGFDPELSEIEFSFKVECPSDFDCKQEPICDTPEPQAPQINYLAKDFSSFRREILDRMSLLMPKWQERNPADLGIALVELLAYVGDHLSYQQDSVSTEAYLNTARKRISVRRHARLVDYFISEGSNSRTWIQIQVNSNLIPLNPGDPPIISKGNQFFSRIAGQSATLPNEPQILDQAEIVFEAIHDKESLFSAHNLIHFYTWSNERCCLPMGSTEATLHGHYPNLQVGEVIVFEEILGPNTGHPDDANISHRHAVRINSIQAFDDVAAPLTDILNGELITKINWAEEDALPFPLCISSRTDGDHDLKYIENVSVARGNIVLADHGKTISNENLGEVPRPSLYFPPDNNRNTCDELIRKPIHPNFRPQLKESPITHAGEYDPNLSATAALQWSLRKVKPQITVTSIENGLPFLWGPQQDLLNSEQLAREFVAEINENQKCLLRFGDDLRGRRPDAGTEFAATYRIGNGTAGNIGADSLAHIRSSHNEITQVRNLLPGTGGKDPESIKDVRHRAPVAFRTQERAVTPSDYQEVTQRLNSVQKAAASFRWTGSWHTVFITVDRKGGKPVTPEYEQLVRTHVEKFRMAGYDLEVDEPVFISLKIEMNVCVHPDYFRSHVKMALLELFSNRNLPNGKLGIFHPDNFTFGQTVYLSPLYEVAQNVQGVSSVQIKTFQRYGENNNDGIISGELPMDRLEIPRLDNDPNFKENGVFLLELAGGK